jgi:hypothetical protein
MGALLMGLVVHQQAREQFGVGVLGRNSRLARYRDRDVEVLPLLLLLLLDRAKKGEDACHAAGDRHALPHDLQHQLDRLQIGVALRLANIGVGFDPPARSRGAGLDRRWERSP